MAILVTRPQPDDEATAANLRARGFEVLKAPMLRFEPVASGRGEARLRRGDRFTLNGRRIAAWTLP